MQNGDVIDILQLEPLKNLILLYKNQVIRVSRRNESLRIKVGNGELKELNNLINFEVC